MKPHRPVVTVIAIALGLAFPVLTLAQEKKSETVRPDMRAAPGERRPIVLQEVEVRIEGVILQDPRRATIRRYVELFRPTLYAEYRRIVTVCELSGPQRKRIAREGERILRGVAEKLYMPANRVWTPSRPRITAADGHKLVEEGLAEAVEAHLRTEQSARYAAEVEARILERKDVAIRQIVVELDRDLFLSAEQRERICAALASHWDVAWFFELEASGRGLRSNNPSLKAHIAPVLNTAQYSAWLLQSKDRNSVVRSFAVAHLGDVVTEDEDLAEARQAQVKEDAGRDGGAQRPDPAGGKERP